ncbi:MAG: glycosyltransferase family 39 protein [Planctomycetales bacterium]
MAHFDRSLARRPAAPFAHEEVSSVLRRALRSDSLVLLGLFALCLVPRLLMAWRLGVVCNDGYYYIRMAAAIEAGDFEQALAYLNLNVYPPILAALHRLGLEWESAGKLWGAIASSLAVLPMFGWVRAAFDRRVAVAACFLYAIHPDLIEVGVEPIREATFWLFACTSLWLIWKAVERERLGLFALAGASVALAIHTRTEGWVLVIPAVLWPCLHLARNAHSRRETSRRSDLIDDIRLETSRRRSNAKLLAGPVLCLTMTPLFIVAANATLLRDHPQWEWGRLAPFQKCWRWLHDSDLARAKPATPLERTSHRRLVVAPFATAGIGHPGGLFSRGSTAIAAAAHAAVEETGGFVDRPEVHYVRKLVSTLEPVNCLLLLAGLCASWRQLPWRTKLVLALLSWSLLGGVWIQLRESREFNGRYFLTLYLVLVPFAGIGLLLVASRVGGWARRRGWVAPRSLAPALAIALLLAAGFWSDALSTTHPGRESQATLGRWLRAEYGPFDSVVVDPAATCIGYYAHGELAACPDHVKHVREAIAEHRPQLLVVCTPDRLAPKLRALIERQAQRHGLRPVAPDDLPDDATPCLVMVRAERLARTPSAAALR